MEQDEKFYVEWLEKATKQNNPWAMYDLGIWFRFDVDDAKKAVSYYRAGAELGWKDSMDWLAVMLREGEGCEKDLRQAAIWGAKGNTTWFWAVFKTARDSLAEGTTEQMTCDFDQLCYTLGWGLYWYQHGSEGWNQKSDEEQALGNRILNYYCSCVEMQQKSIFTFLWCWNRTTGVKGPGQIIGQMVWEHREENFLKAFE